MSLSRRNYICLIYCYVITSQYVCTSKVLDRFPCIARKFDHDSIVCVCNSSYCDAAPSFSELAAPFVNVMTTSRSGKRLQVEKHQWKPNPSFQYTNNTMERHFYPTALSINVSAVTVRQTVLGFGGAFTDSAGINIGKLPEAAQHNLLASYFSANGGIGYTMARVPIGGCDFSPRAYSYADKENDLNLSHFALAEEDYRYKIPYLKAAINMSGNLKVIGSPWSAPAWMKTNKKLTGKGNLEKRFYGCWADYLKRFVMAYYDNGIPIWALTTQNEPLDGFIPNFSFNSMAWEPRDQAEWVRQFLAPSMASLSEHANMSRVKLLVMDDQRFQLPFWVNEFFSDQKAYDSVDGIALHWYSDPFYPSAALDEAHYRLPDKFLLNTEACEGSMYWQLEKVALGSWQRAENYATDIINDLNHWVTGWIDWNIALDMKGGPNWVNNFVDSPIIVDHELKQFYKQPMFYAMAHFSLSLPPGTTILRLERINKKLLDRGLLVVLAETPSKYYVMTIINRSDDRQHISISDTHLGVLPLSIEAKSLTTLKWRKFKFH